MSAITLNSNQIADLFEHHSAAIVAFLMNRVACPETARDLGQETYLRLLAKGEIAHDENVIGYLFRIADRLAIDYLRQTKKTIHQTEVLSDELLCPRLQPDVLTDLRQQCERLLAAINAMPFKYRQVFLLRKVDELSYSEIAAQLNISEKTVQRYLVHAMLHCHSFMDD